MDYKAVPHHYKHGYGHRQQPQRIRRRQIHLRSDPFSHNCQRGDREDRGFIAQIGFQSAVTGVHGGVSPHATNPDPNP